MISLNATRADFEYVLDCIRTRVIKPETYITHRVKFGEAKNIFPSWLDPEMGVVKAMIEVG
jgi:threonine dehydrogenase-like Zn-dependent dehydrogenase